MDFITHISDEHPYSATVMPATSSLIWGLVGYWTLDEATGIRADSAGNTPLSPSGSASGSAGKIGNALSCSYNNFINVWGSDNPILSMGDLDFEICGWFYNAGNSLSSFPTIISKGPPTGGGANANYEFWAGLSSGTIYFIVGSGGGSGQVTQTIPSTNTWHFYNGYHDSVKNTIGLSIDGGAFVSTSYSNGSYNSIGTLAIGADPTYVGGFFSGLLDEWGIWKRILSTSERSKLYNNGTGSTYPFA